MFKSGLQLGRQLGSPSGGPLAGWRRARLARLFDGGATLRLQYPKEDLGFVYSDSGAPVSSAASCASSGLARAKVLRVQQHRESVGIVDCTWRQHLCGRCCKRMIVTFVALRTATLHSEWILDWLAGAVCAKADTPGESAARATGGREAPYMPTTAPGARLPHVWLTAQGELSRVILQHAADSRHMQVEITKCLLRSFGDLLSF